MDTFLFIVLAVFLLCIISGGYLFFAACRRRKELPWLNETEIKKTSYAKYYDYIVNSHMWLTEHRAQDVWVNSYDGLQLHGLWIPAKKPRGTILFAHGYRSTPLVDFSFAMDYYHQLGWNLLIPEQRSHGKSQGKFITFGVKESRDMQVWIEFHNHKFGKQPIVLDGLSMGASTMLYLTDKQLPENVKGIIADCGFTSPAAIISKVFRSITHLPAVPSIWVAELFARIFAGISLYECNTIKSLANSRLPVFMVHGTGDDFVPCEMTKQGYSSCNSPKQLLLAEDAPHGCSFLRDRERYCNMICDFLDKYVGKQ